MKIVGQGFECLGVISSLLLLWMVAICSIAMAQLAGAQVVGDAGRAEAAPIVGRVVEEQLFEPLGVEALSALESVAVEVRSDSSWILVPIRLPGDTPVVGMAYRVRRVMRSGQWGEEIHNGDWQRVDPERLQLLMVNQLAISPYDLLLEDVLPDALQLDLILLLPQRIKTYQFDGFIPGQIFGQRGDARDRKRLLADWTIAGEQPHSSVVWVTCGRQMAEDAGVHAGAWRIDIAVGRDAQEAKTINGLTVTQRCWLGALGQPEYEAAGGGGLIDRGDLRHESVDFRLEGLVDPQAWRVRVAVPSGLTRYECQVELILPDH